MPRPVATERRAALLDAALEVVVGQGLRGLTHRAVDRAADVAEGTTSAYFRTRRALHLALAERVTHRLADDVDRALQGMAEHDAASPEAVDRVAALFTGWLAETPLLLAKVELTLEAGRDPELAALLASDRDRVVGLVADVLAAHDPGLPGDPGDDPARRAAVVVASFDGVLLAAVTRPPEDRDAFVADAVRQTLAPLSRDDGC